MRALSFLLALGLFGAFAPPAHAASVAFDARGSYLAGEIGPLLHAPGNPGVTVTACDLHGDLNGVFSSCDSFGDAAVGGLVARVAVGGTSAPSVQGVQVCFYSAYGFALDCPPDEACGGFAWCARVPAGSKIFGVASATGVDVQWHMTVA